MAKNKISQGELELARLKNRLQLPLVVRDHLMDHKLLADDETYALHETLSEMEAHDVIVCAAMCLKEIADYEGMDFSGYNFLHTECNRMIKRYANALLFNRDQDAFWDERFSYTLSQLSSDLESFTEIVELCLMSFEILNPCAADVLQVLSTQLQSQMLIVDEIAGMHAERREEPQEQPSMNIGNPQMTGYGADNVVLFTHDPV